MKADMFCELQNCLVAALPKKKCALGFSGGLDSSILAMLCSDCVLYTVGYPGSQDVITAVKCAKKFAHAHKIIEIDNDSLIDAIKAVGKIIGTNSPHIILYEVPMYLLFKECAENVVVVGQGADELFGGYKKYMSKNGPQIMNKDVEMLPQVAKREQSIARVFGKQVVHPYMSKCVHRIAVRLCYQDKIASGIRKKWLRDFAVHLGLDVENAMREKKAMQYGTGVVKAVRRLAKAKGMKPREYIQWIVSRAAHGGYVT